MAATPVYNFPYAALSDPPHGPNQQGALALAVEGKFVTVDAAIATVEDLLAGFSAPAQTGSGSLSSAATATIMSVAIPDPGFAYHIIASGSIDWAMTAGAVPGHLFEGSITIDSLVYNVNRLRAGFASATSLTAGFTQSTLHVGEYRSDAYGAFVGAKTVRLIARNSGTSGMTIPASSSATALSVRIVPA